MKNLKNNILMTTVAVLVLAGGMLSFAANPNTLDLNKTKAPAPAQVNLDLAAKTPETKAIPNTTPPANAAEYTYVSPIAVVNNPSAYLNKKIKFKASFDKFSTLGLDYKPAFRDSQKYISFLIKREDVTDHTIPLSEMKIFIKRDEAEKFIELDSGDIIEVYGKVFSDALTDAWVDTDKLILISKKNKDTKKKV